MEQDEASISPATVLERPAKGAIDPPPIAVGSRSHGGTTTIASPLEALARDEVVRTRNYCFMAFGLVLGGLAAIPFLPGGYYTTRIFIVGIFVALAGMSYMLYRARDPATFHQGPGVGICWIISAAATNTTLPYFGAYSPVPILMLIGIYFVGLGQSRAAAIATYAICAASHAVSGLLATADVIEPGIIRSGYLPLEAQLVTLGLIQMVYAAAFYIARASRRASLGALEELQAAVRAVAQREALLQEAREELQRALGAGRGRFTDQMIGHYRLGDVIGRGAMGEVYEGVDARTDQPVAIKMLSQASLGNAAHVKRFLRELRTASAIDSPNVVRVLDIGEEPLPHLAMERLHGRDLSSILRDVRVLEPAKVVDLIEQIGAGITIAGNAGVIHRDLKPQNVFLAGATWKILDFGVSRLADTSDTLTAGHLIGTPAYMAPEQARGNRVDHRTDLYALAAIAYRCLTGHALFSGTEVAEVLYRVVHSAPRRPGSLASLPTDVDLALAIGLAKRPAERFTTAGELASALRAACTDTLSEEVRRRGRGIFDAWA